MRKTKGGVLPNKRGVLMLIDKIRIEDLSYERFLSDYADKKPFILLGAMENWECRQWTLDFIKEKYGDRIVTIRKSDIEGVKTFKQVRLANYIEHIHDNEDRWYCDWNFTALNQKDLDLVYSSPDYFTKDTLRVDDETGQDFKWFFSDLNKQARRFTKTLTKRMLGMPSSSAKRIGCFSIRTIRRIYMKEISTSLIKRIWSRKRS